MQHLEVSCAVRLLVKSSSFKGLIHRGISSALSQKSRTKEKSLKNVQVVLEQKERVKKISFSAVNCSVNFVLSGGKANTTSMP